MKKVISVILALSVAVSLCMPCVFAADTRAVASGTPATGVIYDTASASKIESSWSNLANELLALLPGGNVADFVAHTVLWSSLGTTISTYGIGEIADDGRLEQLASTFKRRYFNAPAFGGYFSALPDIYGKVSGIFNDVQVAYDDTYGVYRLYDNSSGLWLTAENGSFPYYIREESAPVSSSKWKWVPMEEARSNYQLSMSYTSASELLRCGACANFNLGEDRKYTVEFWKKDISESEGVYYPIYYLSSPSDSAAVSSYVLTFDGKIVNYIGDGVPLAVETPFDYFDTPDEDNQYEVGDTVTQQLVDLSQFTVNFIDNSETINNAWYDMSDRSYHVSTSYFNFTNNYYYEYNYEINYHINYTSVTYIGQTAEYNETYEFYYQLPDGRSSADLTVEELQALNTQIDVLPYIRSADDTSIRALYHFDGDALDSSYWSYAGNLEWISGASITYMDAGAFNGALFLDETAHKFNVNLPSTISSSDFTLQFRYYQSATLAPVTDSSISIGGTQVMQLSGDAFILPDGSTVQTSIGNWQELCFMRKDGVIYIYHNGVCVGSYAHAGGLGNALSFSFGSEQQTYKYFDELRFVSTALYDPASNYIPTSVPFDTNLALVLPDSQIPVADAFLEISEPASPVSPYTIDQFSGGSGEDFGFGSISISNGNDGWPAYTFYTSNCSAKVGSTSTTFLSSSGTYDGLLMPLANANKVNGTTYFTPYGNYTVSVVFADGTVSSYSFTCSGYLASTGGYYVTNLIDSKVFEWGSMGCFAYGFSNASYTRAIFNSYLYIKFTEASEVAYIAVYSGSEGASAELIESVVVMDKDDLNTPSLAVRTDINITGYQIGGVRPSLPTKGLVWALVEDGMITSLQIYNGQAWEAVDGRIWTGTRWVPYYAYDVILLKDLYDIVESDPSLDYIYTESGFWKWLQGAWSQMMGQLSDIENAISGSGSGSGTINPNIPDADKTGFFESLGDVFLSIFSSIGDLLTGIFGFFSDTVFGGIRNFFSVFTDGSLFEGFQQTDEEGNTTTALPDGVSAVFAFFAGIFLVLPEEIRLILFFAIGLLIFMGVLKVVIS